MSKWIFLTTPCLACLIFLAAGALSRPVRGPAATAQDSFRAQPLPLDQANPHADLDGASLDGAGLIDRLLASLRDVRWLNVAIWQRWHDRSDAYESEARLALGPDQCARLTTTVYSAAGTCRFLVVSDGRALAEVFERPGAPPHVVGTYLPASAPPALREQILRKRGCAGPQALVAALRDLHPAWRVQTGVWRERPVFRLEAALDAAQVAAHAQAPVPSAARPNLAAHSCRLYLDAVSLWPARLEWYRGVEPRPAELLLEMEFRDPELNRALTREECARLFSYQP
ncbi:MAG: hypothetical protein L0Y71_09530 [Gemmataceae bacterium]|nr:hypothetical protein [Gemmataceae bacterium]